MCSIRNADGTCNLLNRTVPIQNQLAEKGECTEAEISGPATRYPDLLPPEYRYGEVVGRMVKSEIGDWIFQAGTFTK